MTVSKRTTQEKARQLFSVATQGEGSFIVNFKGEFYDEFPEKDGAQAWVEDMSAKFADFADSLTAELQKENTAHAKNAKILVDENNRLEKVVEETTKALGIHFCPDPYDEEPWEVLMEPEPDYFKTLPEAAAFLFKLLDKGLSDREKENARLREALEKAFEWAAKFPLQSPSSPADYQAAQIVYGACIEAIMPSVAVLSKEKAK